MRNFSIVLVVVAGLMFAPSAQAQRFSISFGSGYGGQSHYGHNHYNFNGGYYRTPTRSNFSYYSRGYQPSYYGGYRSSNFGNYNRYPVYHDTSHYDYHPGGFVPHGNHYHYQPGHYDYHQTGHYHY